MANENDRRTTVIEDRQIVAFNLGEEEYGVDIMQVQEIVRLPEITRIPQMPDFVEGVINLRGKIIPIIDLRKRFNISEKERTEKTRIVVADAGVQTIGLIVDGVSEVLRINENSIDTIPPSIASIDTEYLNGVAKFSETRLIILLDLKKLLTELEKEAVSGISSSENAAVGEVPGADTAI